MTTSLWILVGFLVVLWGAGAWLLRRKSLFPVIPVVPGVALFLGLLLEKGYQWLGTATVVVLHLIPLSVAAIVYRRRGMSSRDDARG